MASMSGLVWFSMSSGQNLVERHSNMSTDSEWNSVVYALAAVVGASLMDVKRNATVYFRGKVSGLPDNTDEQLEQKDKEDMKEKAMSYLGYLLATIQKADPVSEWNTAEASRKNKEFRLFFRQESGPGKGTLLIKNVSSPLDNEQRKVESPRKRFIPKCLNMHVEEVGSAISKVASGSGLVWYCLNHGYNLTVQYCALNVTLDWHQMTLCLAACVGAALMDTKREANVYFRNKIHVEWSENEKTLLSQYDKESIVTIAVVSLQDILQRYQQSVPNPEWLNATASERQEAFRNFFIKDGEYEKTQILKTNPPQQEEDTVTEQYAEL
jgi:hypothetical protein